MRTGVLKKRGNEQGRKTPKFPSKQVVDFLLATAVAEDLPEFPHSQRVLYYAATKAASEFGSQSKIDSLMMFYAAGLDQDSKSLVCSNVVIGGFLDHIETLGPKASRKAGEAAVKSMVRVGAHRRARSFAFKYLGRQLDQEEFDIALEKHCGSAMYSTADDDLMVAWANDLSSELASEVAVRLRARMKKAGYGSK
jgi:hypothetical protein